MAPRLGREAPQIGAHVLAVLLHLQAWELHLAAFEELGRIGGIAVETLLVPDEPQFAHRPGVVVALDGGCLAAVQVGKMWPELVPARLEAVRGLALAVDLLALGGIALGRGRRRGRAGGAESRERGNSRQRYPWLFHHHAPVYAMGD